MIDIDSRYRRWWFRYVTILGIVCTAFLVAVVVSRTIQWWVQGYRPADAAKPNESATLQSGEIVVPATDLELVTWSTGFFYTLGIQLSAYICHFNVGPVLLELKVRLT